MTIKRTISVKTLKDILNKRSFNLDKLCANKRHPHSHIQSGWRTIGGIKAYFRSKAEANYARYLQYLKSQGKIKDWLHEPTTFWFHKIKRGVKSYLPDFKVIHLDGSHTWYEVKGHMDAKSLTKIKRMAKYYPDEKLEVVDSTTFNKQAEPLSGIIPGWE